MKRVFLLFVVVVALTSYAFAPRTPVLAFQGPTYGNCAGLADMKLTEVCEQYHPEGKAFGVVGTAACVGADCFNSHVGYEITIMAGGKPGDFPRTWLASVSPHGGELNVTKFACEGCDQCDLPKPGEGRNVGQGIQIALRDGNPHPNRCKAERIVGEHIYHEHFASNPNTKCLAWIECREDNIPLTH